MAEEPIPPELREFILQHIDSIAQLEALLLLRASSQEQWSIAKTAKRLYITEQQADEVLSRLCADGLLACEEDLYRYREQSSHQAGLIDRLADAYAKHLIPITNMIHAKPRRIREFADAFKFRKDK